MTPAPTKRRPWKELEREFISPAVRPWGIGLSTVAALAAIAYTAWTAQGRDDQTREHVQQIDQEIARLREDAREDRKDVLDTLRRELELECKRKCE